MTHFADDIYLGGFAGGTQAFSPLTTTGRNPTAQVGVGPMGRVVFHNIKPLALSTTNISPSTVLSSTTLPLAAGTGITTGLAPDGSGSTVYVLDTPRCVSLSSTSNLSAITFTVTGYDLYGRLMTSAVAGPNNNTVHTLKAFFSVLSIVASTTNAGSVSAGTSDVFGLPWVCFNAVYIFRTGWDSTLANNAGTFVAADTTSPATSSTGDTRGTYAQTGNASNGSRQLIIGWHLDGTQVGPSATIANAIGVTPA